MSQIARFTVIGHTENNLREKLIDEIGKIQLKRFWNDDNPSPPIKRNLSDFGKNKIEFLTKIGAKEDIIKDSSGILLDAEFWIRALVHLAKKYNIAWDVDFEYDIKGVIPKNGKLPDTLIFKIEKDCEDDRILSKITFE